MTSSKFILLTGAGFTHNFGAPLACDLWAVIMNHQDVQKNPRIREVVLTDFDFESVYHSVMSSDYSADEKTAMANAIEYAYAYVDDIVRSWGFHRDASYSVNVYKVQELIASFVGTYREPGFFFTLNQDLFLERHYYNGERPRLPGITQHRDWFSSHFRDRLQQPDYVTLPNDSEIDDGSEFLGHSRFYYIKLHGSCNWRTTVGLRRMVIGHGKEYQISDEPLLARYFDIFGRVLADGGRRLLVIGYGFRDPHVNKVIATAVEEHGLQIFIMTPESPASLHATLSRTEAGFKIWFGLGGYFQCSLARMFPADQSESTEWRAVKNQYFLRQSV